MECYNYLEPLYNDYRKLKKKNRNGGRYCFTVHVQHIHALDYVVYATERSFLIIAHHNWIWVISRMTIPIYFCQGQSRSRI